MIAATFSTHDGRIGKLLDAWEGWYESQIYLESHIYAITAYTILAIVQNNYHLGQATYIL